MRIFAAILAVLLGTTLALAQGDPRAYFGPIDAKPGAKAKSKAKAAGKRAKPATAKAKPAKTKPAAKKEQAAAKPAVSAKADAKAKPDKDRKPDARRTAKADAKSVPLPPKPAAANASTAKSAPVPVPSVKPGPADMYAALPLAERVAIQADLIWTGDYSGAIDGEFSEQLVEAVKSYQKRNKNKVTGLLSAKEREALAEAIRPRQEELGWRLVEDPVTGARVGIPGKVATVAASGPAGTRWSSEQGQLQIETFRIDTGATLEAVFAQQKKQRRRRVTHDAIKPDSFVVLGTQGLKKFYVRAVAKDGEVRGITILYDQAMSGTIDPLVKAMVSAFVPFARYTVASAGTAEVARRRVEYGTGLLVSAEGHIVTARHVVDGCRVIAIPRLGDAERLVQAKDSELALLRVYGLNGAPAIGLPVAAAKPSDKVSLVGIADPQAQGGGAAVTAVGARIGAANPLALEPAPEPGFSGAAALDAQGRLVGIAVHRTSIVAGAGGAPHAALVPLTKLRTFLEANAVIPIAAPATKSAAESAAVRVVCVRK